MKLALLLPDGAGVRNFVLGRFLDDVCAKGSVIAFHQLPDQLVAGYSARLPGRVQWRPLIPQTDSPAALVLRNALAFAHMYWADTESMRYARQIRFGGSWRTRLAMGAARSIGKLAATQSRLRLLESGHTRVVQRLADVDHYVQVFRELQPSVLFSTNQRAGIVVAAVLAAKRLKIPTAAFIFSWDNLSSKGRIAAPFDYYFVWSEAMRAELAAFYPDVPLERISVVGTPQFDPYRDVSLLWSKAEFCRKVGAHPNRPIICYSGGDQSIYGPEPEFVRILLDFIRSGRIKGQPQVLLRPSPADDGVRYAALRNDYPELLFRPPLWLHTDPGNWTRIVPRPEDVQLLANLTHHADLNINLASTMTLDFAIHDKPVVNVAFDVVDPPPMGRPLWDLYYRFEHYRPVVELGAARFARSQDQLAEHVNAYLSDPSLDRDARRRFVALEVGAPLGEASARTAAALARIAGDQSQLVQAGRDWRTEEFVEQQPVGRR
jgi:hypothetical protein